MSGRDLFNPHRAIERQGLDQIVVVVTLQRPGRDQVEALRGLLEDGKFSPHAALGGQEIGQADLADDGRYLIGEQAIEPRLCTGARDLELGKGAHILKADLGGHMAAFGPNMFKIVRAAEAPLFADRLAVHLFGMVFVEDHVRLIEVRLGQGIAFRREPVGTLPAIDRAKDRAQSLHPIIAGRAAQTARGGALFIGIVRGKDLGIGLFVLFSQIALTGIGAKAARIDTHHVDGRLAINDPMRQLPACAARSGDAEAVAFIEPEVLQTPGWTDNGAAVGGIGDGTIIDALDADLAKGRNAGDGGFNMGGQTVEVLLEQLIFRLWIRAINIADRRADLVGTKQKAPSLLAQVPGTVALAQDAHFRQTRSLAGLNSGVSLGDDILVLDRNDRHIKADHRAGAPSKVAGS